MLRSSSDALKSWWRRASIHRAITAAPPAALGRQQLARASSCLCRTDRVELENVVLYTRIGVSEAERQIPIPLSFDVQLYTDLRKAGDGKDDLSSTIDYGEAYKIIRDNVAAADARCKLLETLAEGIAAGLLSRFPIAHGVQLRCIKLKPPLEGYVSGAGLTIFRTRAPGSD